jgi:hypothetical protein
MFDYGRRVVTERFGEVNVLFALVRRRGSRPPRPLRCGRVGMGVRA